MCVGAHYCGAQDLSRGKRQSQVNVMHEILVIFVCRIEHIKRVDDEARRGEHWLNNGMERLMSFSVKWRQFVRLVVVIQCRFSPLRLVQGSRCSQTQKQACTVAVALVYVCQWSASPKQRSWVMQRIRGKEATDKCLAESLCPSGGRQLLIPDTVVVFASVAALRWTGTLCRVNSSIRSVNARTGCCVSSVRMKMMDGRTSWFSDVRW